MTFNPDSPDVLGLQWEPLHEDRTPMDSPLTPLCARLESSASETVDEVHLYSAASAGRTPESYQLDVYEDGDYPDGQLAVVTAYPAADAGVAGASTWDGSVVGTSSYYSFIANVSQTPVNLPDGQLADDDFIFATAGQAYAADFRFDGLAALLAGRHIARVRLRAVVQPYAGVGQRGSITVTPYLKIDGTPYPGSTVTLSGRVPGGQEVVQDWYVNPDLLRSWAPDDLDKFDSGTATAAAGWTVGGTGSGFILAAILQGQLEVHHAGNDLRVATGHVARADQLAGAASGWFGFDVSEPDGTPGWAKMSGTTYRLEWKRQTLAAGGLRLFMVALAGYDDRTVNGWSRLQLRSDPDSRLPAAADPVTDGRSWAPGCAMVVGGGVSVDSQPYVELDEADTAVFAGHEVRQYLTTPGTLPVTTFSVIRAVVGKRGATASGPLTMSVHRASDDAQLGSSVTLTPDEFDALPGERLTGFATYRTVDLEMVAGATLATSTQYYVSATSTAADEDTGWRIEVARADRFPSFGDVLPAGIEDATFGGTADTSWRDGIAYDQADAAVVLATPVVQVAGVVALAGTDGCVGFVSVAWDATALGGTFLRYEVQRQDRAGGVWYLVATVIAESVDAWDDLEAAGEREAWYRVRVVRGDRTAGPWSAAASAVTPAPCCGYTFTSNVAPDLSIWADDRSSDGVRDTDTPQNVEVVQFDNRKFQVGFHELEDRGERFKRRLVVAVRGGADGTQPAAEPGREVFNPLRAITRPSQGAGLPYVCVRDESGNRWFATVLTPSTAVHTGHGTYQADAEVVEVTDVPFAPTVEA